MEMKLEQAVERIGGGRVGADKARPAEKTDGPRETAVAARKAAAPVLPAKRGRERDVGLGR